MTDQDPRIDEGALPTVGRYLLIDHDDDRRENPRIAYDPQLDRAVSLYVFDASSDAGNNALARARTWAGLAHRNVLTVHDSGVDGSRAYVAVERTPGPALGAWLGSDREHELYGVLADVGRGLQAAHDAGLAHGSLGPDAVVIEGRGVARLGGFALDSGPASTDSVRADVEAMCRMTRDVLARGSRAPKQPVTEALDRLESASRGETIPRLDDLIEALAWDPGRARRRRALAATILTVAVVSLLAIRLAGHLLDPVCSGAEDRIAGVWGRTQRARVEEAFVATQAPFAEQALLAVTKALDERARTWASIHTDACLATRRDAVEPEDVLDRRMACLNERRAELEATVEVLGRADADIVARSLEIVDGLPAIEGCMAEEGAPAFPPPAPGQQPEVERGRVALSRAQTIARAGEYDEALAIVEQAAEQAQALGYPPLLAESLEAEGTLLVSTGNPQRGADTLRQATREAWRAGHDRIAADAWIGLMSVLGETLARERDADTAWHWAQAAIDRLGSPAELQADLLAARAIVMFARGRYRESAELHREALELRLGLYDPDHTKVVSTRHNLANALNAAGDTDEALREYESVLEVWEKTLGPDHPNVASVHNNMGVVYLVRGDLPLAERHFEITLDIRRRALGTEHMLVADVLGNLGVVSYDQGDYDEAMARHQESLRIKQKVLPEQTPAVADAWLNIGTVLHQKGDYDGAIEDFERALAAYEASLGNEHPWVGLALHNIGWSLRAAGRPAQAVAPLRRALAIREAAFGPKHDSVASTCAELGLALLKLGDRGEAKALLERASSIWQANPPEEPSDQMLEAQAALEKLGAR